MARLLRSQGVYKLRPPLVVGPSTVFAPVTVRCVAIRSREDGDIRRASSYALRQPAVIAPPVVFKPVAVYAAVISPEVRNQARNTRSKLEPPVVIGSATVFAPVKTRLVPSPTQGRASHSKLRVPVVISAAVVFAPIRTKLAPAPRPLPPKYRLQPPTIMGVVGVVFVAPALRIYRTLASKPPKTQGILRKPTVVGAAIVSAPLRIYRTFTSRPPATRSKLQAPATLQTVVTFIATPLRIFRAPPPSAMTRRTRSLLRAPTIITAFFPLPIRVKLVTLRRRMLAVVSRLRAPTVITPFVPPTDSGFGAVGLSDVPLYDLALADVELYAVTLRDSALYETALADAALADVGPSDSAVFEVGLSDIPGG